MARNGSAAARAEQAGNTERAGLRPVTGRRARSGANTRLRSAKLSGKERAVLRELARGFTTEEIGEVLNVSPHTVRTHIKNGMRKLEAKTRAHAVAIALSEGAIEFEPLP